MSEKKFQVFVSSTYEDLKDERAEVIQALLELDCIPVGMELFPASDDDQWTLIKRLIDDCDYYILIVGGRYGSTNKEGVSYTQMEYEYALSSKIPIISFLPKDPESISLKNTDRDKDLEVKLIEFKTLVSNKTIKHYDSPVELGSIVSRSLIKLIKTHPQPGWVKGDSLSSVEANAKILDLKQKIEDLEERLNIFNVDVDDLSQGDDIYSLEYTLSGIEDRQNIEISWNKLFEKTAPLIIDETSEEEYKKHIQTYIEHLRSTKGLEPRKVWIVTDFFKQILIQFKALGLIKKGSKKRSLKDTDTYWTLTDKGDSLMTQLRAIRKTDI